MITTLSNLNLTLCLLIKNSNFHMQSVRDKPNVYVHWLPYVFSNTCIMCCSLKMAVDGRNKQEERFCVSYIYFLCANCCF